MRRGSRVLTGIFLVVTLIPAEAWNAQGEGASLFTAANVQLSTHSPIRSLSLSTACTGVNVTPTLDVQAVINRYPGGTTFCFQPGTYVLTKFVFPKSYDQLIALPGTVLTGSRAYAGGLKGYPGSTGQHDVTVQGFIVKRFRNTWDAGVRAAISPGWNWTIEGNDIRYNSKAGISASQGDVIDHNYIHHNGRIGIDGGPIANLVVENNEIAYNNTGNYNVAVESGGVKIVGGSSGSTNLVFRGNVIHDNTGRGLWMDTNVSGVTIENNSIYGNTTDGVFIETSYSAVIQHNILRNNAVAYARKSCYWGAQIQLNDSQNVEIYGNDVRSSIDTNGICAVDIARTTIGSDHVANLSVHDNVVRMQRPAMTGLVGRASAYDASVNNQFSGNTYYVTDTTQKFWAWSAYPVTWSQWRGYGNDSTGSVATW
jgi:parallel beta helix pectate lyase-like protein